MHVCVGAQVHANISMSVSQVPKEGKGRGSFILHFIKKKLQTD